MQVRDVPQSLITKVQLHAVGASSSFACPLEEGVSIPHPGGGSFL